MKALQDGGEAYIVYNNGNRNEYFLLENRQFTGWDASLPGEGLLILHVDYNASAWADNTPNDIPSHQRMTWIPADNEYQYTTYQGSKYYTIEGMANDPFPYGSVNAFNKSTTPAAKFFNKNTDGTYYLDSSIEEITQNTDGTVSFNFKAATNVAKPTFSPAAGRYTEAQTVTISCATEGVAIYYTTDGSTPTASSTRYTSPITIEETTTLKAIAVSADGEESLVATANYTISNTLLYEGMSNDATEATGTSEIDISNTSLDYSDWESFTKVFKGGTREAYKNGGCLKLGTSKVAGSMTTRNMGLVGTGTLSFYLKTYSKDSGTMTVTVTGAKADITSFTQTTDWKHCTVTLTEATGNVKITFATTKRAYLQGPFLLSPRRMLLCLSRPAKWNSLLTIHSLSQL